jgi:serine/threonine protein kinase
MRMLAQLAIGLEARPTSESVVHRDLKPDNIFLSGTHDGDIVKILDFGSVRDNSAGAKKLTVFGTTIGSPYYMAPEQAQGLPTLDQRADVWSLAAITYEALTGQGALRRHHGPRHPARHPHERASRPLSEAGRGAKGIPVARSMPCIEAGPHQEPAELRVPTAGALAEQVGRAYGLTWRVALLGNRPPGRPRRPDCGGLAAGFG